MRISHAASRHWLVALIIGGTLALGSTGAGAVEHAFGLFRVNVTPETAPTPFTPEYEITVEDADMLLTRLRAPYEGTLSNSFVADLTGDGRFEVVVTFTRADGLSTEARVFSWNDSLLEPVRLAALDASQLEGHRGGDEFAVSKGELVRLFQLYKEIDGVWTPTAARKRLRYSFSASKWIE